MLSSSKLSMPRRAAAVALASVLSISALAACSAGQASEAADGGLTPLKILVAPVHFEPAYIADRMGFFEEQGLDVSVQPGADAQANFAQALSGGVDIVTTSWTVMATSNAEGVPVTAIASNGYISAESKGSGVLVRPDSGISSVADLAGKTIGVQGVRSGSDLAVLLAAEDAGIDPDSLVQVALPFPAMQAALESGQVDAVMAVDPFFSQISAAGMENLGNMQAQFTPDVPSTVWATTDNWLAENAETAEKFAAAMEDAVEYYEDPANLEEVRAITAEISQTDIEKVTKVLPTISVSFKRQAASDNLSALSRLGYLTKDVTFEDMVWDRAPMN